jgi:hypothetical protein
LVVEQEAMRLMEAVKTGAFVIGALIYAAVIALVIIGALNEIMRL